MSQSWACGQRWAEPGDTLNRTAVTNDNNANLELFLRHRGALVEYATPLVGDRARAEDIVQDAYLRFAPRETEAGDGIKAITQPLGYLYRVVRNLALDLGRRRKSEQAIVKEPAWWLIPATAR